MVAHITEWRGLSGRAGHAQGCNRGAATLMCLGVGGGSRNLARIGRVAILIDRGAAKDS